MIKNFQNPEGHQNPISGSKVMVILLKGWILPTGGASSGEGLRLQPAQQACSYIKLLDFADFAVQAANSRIGPFASRVLNLNHLIHKKSENLQWEKCSYITGREKTFSNTAQYFHLKHLKNDQSVMKNTFFNEMVF